MRVVVQRVRRAEVRVGAKATGRIERGLLVLVAVQVGDGESEAIRMADRLRYLRVFADEEGKMNLDVVAAGGDVLLVSQFTLAAATDRGRRPSFSDAAPPAEAEPLVECLARELRARGLAVQTGEFGAAMEVELVNDGPVTLLLECCR
ncbi:MAG TPA: D-aminoacyl-tRNA deacylase [Thermoanaerobaculia bacterium]|nr:D-aminoacyl-tRNA deacylase [Thermoanaerobaculia bacterium]